MAYRRPLSSSDKKYSSSDLGKSYQSSDIGRKYSTIDLTGDRPSSDSSRNSSDNLGRNYPVDDYGKRTRYSEPAAATPAAPMAPLTDKVVFVGNVPDGATESELFGFLNVVMQTAGLTSGPGNPIVSHKLSSDKNFGLLEFRSAQEASKALGLDGVNFKGQKLRLKLLNENSIGAGTSAPSSSSQPARLPGQHSNPQAARVTPPTRQRVFIQNVPPTVSELDVRELFKMLLLVAGKPVAEIYSVQIVNNTAALQVAANRVADFLELDGSNFKGNKVKITRTIEDYQPPERLPSRTTELGQTSSSFRDKGMDLLPRQPELQSSRATDLGLTSSRLPKDPMDVLPRRSELLSSRATDLGVTSSRYRNDAMDVLPRRSVSSLLKPVTFVPSSSRNSFPRSSGASLNAHTGQAKEFVARFSHPGRVLHVQNLPKSTELDNLRDFLNAEMRIRGLLNRPGEAVIGCSSPVVSAYAFVEFRSEEEATNALELDNINYLGKALKVRCLKQFKSPPPPPELSDPTPQAPGSCRFVEITNVPEIYSGKEMMDFIREQMNDPRCIKAYGYRRELKGYQVKIGIKANMDALLKLDGINFHGTPIKIRKLRNVRRPVTASDPDDDMDKSPGAMNGISLSYLRSRWGKKAESEVEKTEDVQEKPGGVNPQRKNWKVASWNVQGAVGAKKQADIDTALSGKNILLAVIQDTRLPAGCIETEFYSWYVCGEIAVLIRKELKVCVQEWLAVSCTLGIMRLVVNDISFTIIAAHDMPHGLQNAVSGIPPDWGHIFVISDFNVKLKKKSNEVEKFVDADQIVFEEGEKGHTLKKILKDNNLFLVTTLDMTALPVDAQMACNCKLFVKNIRSQYGYPKVSEFMVVFMDIRILSCASHPEAEKMTIKIEKE